MHPLPRIRDFRTGDEAVFRRLNEAWITQYFALEAHDRELFDDPVGSIIDLGGTILILELGGEAVGCCALIPVDETTLELAKMAVAAQQRGRGLGRLLLEAAIERARRAGKRRVVLETNSRLEPAVRLYRSLGFRDLPAAACEESHYARVDLVMELLLDVARGA